jgi:hypothetical protein
VHAIRMAAAETGSGLTGALAGAPTTDQPSRGRRGAVRETPPVERPAIFVTYGLAPPRNRTRQRSHACGIVIREPNGSSVA